MDGSTFSDSTTDGRIYIISSASIQTRSLASLIEERTGMKCSVQSELRRCATTVSVTSHPTLILVDSLFVDPPSALDQLEHLPNPLGSHVMLALMNTAKDEMDEVRAVTLGVRGLFYRSADLDFLVEGIASMFEGEVWVPRKVLAEAISTPMHHDGSHNQARKAAELLTRRERQILAFISTGSSNDEIAAELNISTNTVRTHVYNLYRKIHVPNRMQAVLWGAENL